MELLLDNLTSGNGEDIIFEELDVKYQITSTTH